MVKLPPNFNEVSGELKPVSTRLFKMLDDALNRRHKETGISKERLFNESIFHGLKKRPR